MRGSCIEGAKIADVLRCSANSGKLIDVRNIFSYIEYVSIVRQQDENSLYRFVSLNKHATGRCEPIVLLKDVMHAPHPARPLLSLDKQRHASSLQARIGEQRGQNSGQPASSSCVSQKKILHLRRRLRKAGHTS